MQHGYSYAASLAASERVHWRVEDLIGEDKTLDFTRPFMPESLARVTPLTFLSPGEQRTLNQIRGNGYLCLFGLVEEFILPFVLDHARPQLHGDDHRTRAMLQFAEEEAKHIHLFNRFRAAFEDGFGSTCGVIGPPQAIAKAVLAHNPLSVALVILHIEWMTQRHYVDSVSDDQDLDAQFKSLLKHHWMEEAQHAKLDTLMIEALADDYTEAEIAKAIDGYFEIGMFLDEGLKQQMDFDMQSLTQATGRSLSDDEQAAFSDVQLQALRWTFLGSGMTHPNFLGTVAALHSGAEARVREVAPAFC